jgi:hypothetical protein
MITYTPTGIKQHIYGNDVFWDVERLFTTVDPLAGASAEDRIAAFDYCCTLVETRGIALSPTASDCHYFWTQLQRVHLPEVQYEYTIQDATKSQWGLQLNSLGLFFEDKNGKYNGTPGTVYHQVLSDFWFHGPSYPIPELATRQWLVAHIRNAFRQIGPVSRKHFPLMEYPQLFENKVWEEGNADAAAFVMLTPYGLETGRSNWHDGLVYLHFISFERMLCHASSLPASITPSIQQYIHQWLVPPSPPEPLEEDDRISQERMKAVYMANGGARYGIFFDLGEAYQPDPGNEAIWKTELIETLHTRLQQSTDPDLIRNSVQTLHSLGVQETDQWLVLAGTTAAPKVRMAIAQVLREDYQNDAAVQATLSLLEFEDGSDYWLQYVFHQLANMPDHPHVKKFVWECLNGQDERKFKKAVGILQYWGMQGDHFYQDKSLITALSWEDAIADNPDFHAALRKLNKRLQP